MLKITNLLIGITIVLSIGPAGAALLAGRPGKAADVYRFDDWTLYYDLSKLDLARDGFSFIDPTMSDDYDSADAALEIFAALVASDVGHPIQFQNPRTRMIGLIDGDIFGHQFRTAGVDYLPFGEDTATAPTAKEILSRLDYKGQADLSLSENGATFVQGAGFKIKFFGNFHKLQQEEIDRKSAIRQELASRGFSDTDLKNELRNNPDINFLGFIDKTIASLHLESLSRGFLPNYRSDMAHLLSLAQEPAATEWATFDGYQFPVSQWSKPDDIALALFRRRQKELCRETRVCFLPASGTKVGKVLFGLNGRGLVDRIVEAKEPRLDKGAHTVQLQIALRNAETALQDLRDREVKIRETYDDFFARLSPRLQKLLSQSPTPDDLLSDPEYLAKRELVTRCNELQKQLQATSAHSATLDKERDRTQTKLRFLQKLQKVVDRSEDAAFKTNDALRDLWIVQPPLDPGVGPAVGDPEVFQQLDQ